MNSITLGNQETDNNSNVSNSNHSDHQDGWLRHHVSAGIVSIHVVEEVVQKFERYLLQTNVNDDENTEHVNYICSKLTNLWIENIKSANSLPTLMKNRIFSSHVLLPSRSQLNNQKEEEGDEGDDGNNDDDGKNKLNGNQSDGDSENNSTCRKTDKEYVRKHYLISQIMPHVLTNLGVAGQPLLFMKKPPPPTFMTKKVSEIIATKALSNYLQLSNENEEDLFFSSRRKRKLSMNPEKSEESNEVETVPNFTSMSEDILDDLVDEIQAADIHFLTSDTSHNHLDHSVNISLSTETSSSTMFPTRCRTILLEKSSISSFTLSSYHQENDSVLLHPTEDPSIPLEDADMLVMGRLLKESTQ